MSSSLPFGINFNIPIGEDNEDLRIYLNKTKSYLSSIDYFTDILLSILDFSGFEDTSINVNFLKKILMLKGSIAFVKTDIGLIVSDYITIANDYQGNATQIQLKVTPYFNNIDTKVFDYNKIYQNNEFIIIYLNNNKSGYLQDVERYAYFMALIDIAIENNLLLNSFNCFIEGNSERITDLNTFINDIFNQKGFVKIALPAGAREEDRLNINTVNIPWRCADLMELKHSVKNLFLSRIGIKHTPYEKKERLIVDEVNSADEVNDLLISSMVNTVNDGLKKANDRFDINVSCQFTLETKKEVMQK